MKKLNLNFENLNAEVLTRSQLKQILGGDGGSGSDPEELPVWNVEVRSERCAWPLLPEEHVSTATTII